MIELCVMKKGKRRGQAALEYAMVVTVVGVLLLPAVYLFFNYAKGSTEQIDQAQLDKLGRDTVATAEKVYYLGPPSRILIETRMPDKVMNISIQKYMPAGINVLIFNVTVTGSGVQSFAYDSRVNINGTFGGALAERSVSPGNQQINIEAYEQPLPDGSVIPFAYINFGGRCPRSTTYDYNRDGIYNNPAELNFFGDCYCNVAGRPKYRPSKTWQSGWFDNTGALGGNPYAVCMNADYDADCDIDNDDVALFCATTGFITGICDGTPGCPP